MQHLQRFFPLGICLLFLMGLTGCQQSVAQAPGKEGGAPPPMPVSVSVPVVKEITDYEEFTGRIDAVEKVEIRSRVTGYLDKIHFKSGSEANQAYWRCSCPCFAPYPCRLVRLN